MYTCVFCGNDFDDEGIDDLQPLSDDGFCCEACYSLYVFPAKLKEYHEQLPPDDDEY